MRTTVNTESGGVRVCLETNAEIALAGSSVSSLFSSIKVRDFRNNNLANLGPTWHFSPTGVSAWQLPSDASLAQSRHRLLSYHFPLSLVAQPLPPVRDK